LQFTSDAGDDEIMKNNLSWMLSIAITTTICSLLLFPGCATTSGDSKTQDTPQYGGIINFGQNAGTGGNSPKEYIDPSINWDGWIYRKVGIYQTLFYLDEYMDIKPELAANYTRIGDTEWKIDLRPNVKFHDGSTLNADAVIYSFERGVLNKSNSRHSEYDFIESIEAGEDNSIIIKTTEPVASTIAKLTDPVTSIVSPSIKDFKTEAIGTGPFKYVKHMNEISLSVIRNDDYWGGKPYLDGANFYYYSDPLTKAYKLESGELDIIDELPETEVANIKKNSGLDVLIKESTRDFFLHVNTKKAPLDDANVRHAINYAINRQEIVDSVLEGIGGTPAIGVFPSSVSWSANSKLQPYAHDKEKAMDLLDAAAINDTNGDGLRDYNGKTWEIDLLTYSSDSEPKPTLEVIQAQLADIGVKSNIRIMEWNAAYAETQKGNFDLFLDSWNTLPTGDPDYFLSRHYESTGNEAKITGYSNSQVDDWMKLARDSNDASQRKEYYDMVQQQIFEDSPNIYVFYRNEIWGMNKGVSGFEIYPSEVTYITKDISIE
jgi:peptide/nickel transport system substrate-binding protein